MCLKVCIFENFKQVRKMSVYVEGFRMWYLGLFFTVIARLFTICKINGLVEVKQLGGGLLFRDEGV